MGEERLNAFLNRNTLELHHQLGSERWPEVLAVVRELESLGIYQTDVSPSNIAL